MRHESVASCNALLTGADAPGVRVPAHHTPSHVTGGSTEYRSSDFLPVSVAREEVSQGRGEEEGLTRERRDGDQHRAGRGGAAQVGQDVLAQAFNSTMGSKTLQVELCLVTN